MMITTDHEFMIGASDGVWTVMSSQVRVGLPHIENGVDG